MKAVILAGGLGTRLSEETNQKTKPMVEVDDNHHQMASLHSENSNSKIKVELNTLDSFELSRINGMKIDVEGHELDVLKGAIHKINIQT